MVECVNNELSIQSTSKILKDNFIHLINKDKVEAKIKRLYSKNTMPQNFLKADIPARYRLAFFACKICKTTNLFKIFFILL